ncbi:DUF2946 domain-containing protein [Pseudomonas sp. ITEM 17296]|uniref:DUF2946 domain-containing protein n=2 Tax=Pseudomonas TaxID=286 RepID=A0A3Q8U4L4_9PSED|nr:DUF2946 domain-containing protein [Pseudomonas oryziphila]MDE4536292.1 DUF2946 domain-containing protein [Pseudomonas sp. ITEM 17296]
MQRCGMSKTTWDNLWIAALMAMLFKVFALSVASVAGELSLVQLLSGSYCASGGAQYLAVDKDPVSSSQVSDSGHCCCSQANGPVPITASLLLSRWLPQISPEVPQASGQHRSPRHDWPSINPRASPASIL